MIEEGGLQTFKYDSDLIGGSLQVRESRVVAELLLKGVEQEEWTRAIQDENRLQKKTPATARRLGRALKQRLENVEAPFWQALCDGDDELATQVAFVATLERNLLLVEFMEEVVSDAYRIHAEKLELYQWLDFLEDRSNRDSSIADWSDNSKKKMGQIVFRILAEVGFLDSTRSRKLRNVVVRPELSQLLDNSHRDRIKACINVSRAALS